MDGLIVNLPFQGVTDAMLTFRPKTLSWAEIIFGLQPISKTINPYALKGQFNSAQWQRLGVERTKQNYGLKAQINSTR